MWRKLSVSDLVPLEKLDGQHLMRVKEVALRTGLSTGSVYAEIRHQNLTAVFVGPGKRPRVRVADLQTYMEQRRRECPAAI